MTEQEAFNDPEKKVILLLSGFERELGEGKDFEETTYKTAKQIVKLFDIQNGSKCLHPVDEQETIIRCKKCKRIISNGDIFF